MTVLRHALSLIRPRSSSIDTKVITSQKQQNHIFLVPKRTTLPKRKKKKRDRVRWENTVWIKSRSAMLFSSKKVPVAQIYSQ